MRNRVLVLAVVALATSASAAFAQDAATTAAGSDLYRQRCAECHGADGKGVADHDLTGLWATGASEAVSDRVFRTIRDGVPGTIMPSSGAPETEIRALVAHVRSLNPIAAIDATGGDVSRGEGLFIAHCGPCHHVNGRGGRLGPDLSHIAENRSRDVLVRAIRAPDETVASAYRTVTLVTEDGRRIRGARKSEDAFSIQIMDTEQRLQGYVKSTLREVVRDAVSLMPAFTPERLGEGDLTALLQYLSTPGGNTSAPVPTGR